MGVNGITRATPVYFLTAFVIAFEEIFLEYSWNIFEKVFKTSLKIFLKIHTILLMFMLKIWQKSYFQKIEIHLQVLLLLESKTYSV